MNSRMESIGLLHRSDGINVPSSRDVCRPPLEGAGVGYGPVVDVAALWSKLRISSAAAN